MAHLTEGKGAIGTSLFVVFALILIAGVILLTVWLPKFSQPPAVSQPQKIAMLVSSDLQLATVDGIYEGMKDFDYIEGKDVIYELSNPKGDRELTKTMAKAIAFSKPDLIVPISTTATTAIQEAAQDTDSPIVFIDVANIKELGISDIKHPGGQITGVTSDTVSAGAKRMEILKEVVPKAKVFGILMNPKHVNARDIREVHETAAKSLFISAKFYELTSKEELDSVLNQMIKDRVDGMMTTSEALISSNAEIIANKLRQAKIPSIDFNAEKGVKSGYLIMFGVRRFDTGKQGARLIDKVLKGVKPGDLPVEFSSELKLEINKEVAGEIGVVFPDSILRRAVK